MSKNVLNITHAHCPDGLAASWCIRKAYPDATFVFAKYGDTPPDISGKDVIITDFSYRRETLLAIRERAKSLIVLDHHKTAEEDLKGLPFCVFDMKRSGAGMAWDYVSGENADWQTPARPWPINYIEDRDLWRWALPNSREINALVYSYGLTFEKLDEFAAISAKGEVWERMIGEGAAILRAEQQMVDSIVKKAREVEICGHKVLMANTSVLKSEVAGKLAEGRAFGIAWEEVEDGTRAYSLRSTGFDTTPIARHYGGGGHERASSFRLPMGASL